MAKGTYQISINGFTCLNETIDDYLNRDGNHDEIYFKVNYRTIRGEIDFVPPMDRVSSVLGDINGFVGRIKAGSGKTWWGYQSGGLVSGDSYPNDEPWEQITDPSGRNFPPFVIWEGELTQGSDEVVFLTPTIWEKDDEGSALQGWIDWQVSANTKFGDRAKEIVGGVYPFVKPVFDAVNLGIQTFATIPGIWSIGGKNQSRPIGLQRDPANPDGTIFNPQIIALTYDRAEYYINYNIGLGKGIFSIPYEDDEFLHGKYQIWLQIKKIVYEVPPDEITLPDGDFLAKEASDSEIYIIYGDAKFWIPDMATLSRLYRGLSVNTVPDGKLNRFGAIPKDGTILVEEHSVYFWLMEAGKKRHITTPNLLARYGGKGEVRVVPDYALNNIPIGTPIVESKPIVVDRRPIEANIDNPNFRVGGFPF